MDSLKALRYDGHAIAGQQTSYTFLSFLFFSGLTGQTPRGIVRLIVRWLPVSGDKALKVAHNYSPLGATDQVLGHDGHLAAPPLERR